MNVPSSQKQDSLPGVLISRESVYDYICLFTLPAARADIIIEMRRYNIMMAGMARYFRKTRRTADRARKI